MVKATETGKYRFQMGDGKNMFDFTYVENLAQAHISAGTALLKSHKAPESLSFWDFARSLGAATGYPVKKEEICVIPKSVGLLVGTIAEWVVWLTSFGRKKPTLNRQAIKLSCMTRTYRIDKAKRRLGYKPTISMQEGIRRSGEWMRKLGRKNQ